MMGSSFLDKKSLPTLSLVCNLKRKYWRQKVNKFYSHTLSNCNLRKLYNTKQKILNSTEKDSSVVTNPKGVKNVVNKNIFLNHSNDNISPVKTLDCDNNIANNVACNNFIVNNNSVKDTDEDIVLIKNNCNSITDSISSDNKEVFLREIYLQRKCCADCKLNSNQKLKELKLLKIKENIELLKAHRIGKTTNVYKTVKKRNYLQIKPIENKPPEIMSEIDSSKYYISSRTNRKRKRIDYVSMDHGDQFLDELNESFDNDINKTEMDETLDNKSNQSNNDDETTDHHDSSSKNLVSSPQPLEIIPKKRGRKRKTVAVNEESAKNSGTVSKIITCGVCYLQMEASSWVYHKQRYHNNVTWKAGETPLDIKDESLVTKILMDYYKKKRKPLFCEKCHIAKKSVAGYLSHKALCQKSVEEKESAKVKCEHCDRKVLPVSMIGHLKLCHPDLQISNKKEIQENTANSSKITEISQKCSKTKLEKTVDNEQLPSPKKEPPKKRGRKSKKLKIAISAELCNSSESDSIINESNNEKTEAVKIDTPEEKTPAKDVKKSSFTQISFDNNDEKEIIITKPRRRGRLPKIKRENASSGTLSEIVECAVCKAQLAGKEWNYHKLRKHNNLAWKVGDPEIDLSNKNLVTHILNGIYKLRKPLYCENCDVAKKSVAGYLSHKYVCQKTSEEIQDLRISCEHCERKVLPVSMNMHLKYCRVLKEQEEQEEEEEDIDVSEESKEIPETGTSGRLKRRAATKAEKLFEKVSEISDYSEETYEFPVVDDFAPTTSSKKNKMKPQYFTCPLGSTSSLRLKTFKTELKTVGFISCKFDKCQYQTEDVKTFTDHFLTCDFRPTTGYICKLCAIHYESLDNLKEHLTEEHNDKYGKPVTNEDLNSIENQSDEESESMKNSPTKSLFAYRNDRNVKFLNKALWTSSKSYYFSAARDWTEQFYEENYKLENLFPNFVPLKSNWSAVNPVLISQYLPPLRYSCSVARKIVTTFENTPRNISDWKNYLLFESEIFEDGYVNMFCGGPVVGLAWAPTPFKCSENDQYLAVAVLNSMEIGKSESIGTKPSSIQIWNCGKLINNQRPNQKPELSFCIAHNFGSIMAIEWCPSGCYDLENTNEDTEALKRLGLLAVACSDTNIYIYSVCMPDSLNQRRKIYKPNPHLKLQLVDTQFFAFKNEKVLPTKIFWTKALGHKYLAAGYTNGIAAVFDLESKSDLLKIIDKNDNSVKILPYQILQAHKDAITGLCLYHLNDGRRWLMTSSLDHECKFWDLDNPTIPLCSYSKCSYSDAAWFINWLCGITGSDDCGHDIQVNLNLIGTFGSSQVSSRRFNSRINSLSINDWDNSYIQGFDSGEIIITIQKQLMYALEIDNRKKKMLDYPISYVGLVEKRSNFDKDVDKKYKKDSKNNKSVMNFHNTYETVTDKYGLVFCDFPNVKKILYSTLQPLKDNSDISNYPLASVSKCSCNPNNNSYTFFACGYQAGFVRLSFFDIKNKR